MKLNPAFKAFFQTEKRYVLLFGGAGSGKSHAAAQKILMRAWNDEGHRIPAFRKVKDTVRKSTFQRLKDVISAEDGTRFKVAARAMETTMDINVGGSVLWNLGLDDAEKIKSIREPTSAWVEEADQLNWTAGPDDDFMQVDLRLRGPSPSYKQIILTFNPVARARLIFEHFGISPDDIPEHGFLETGDCFVMHSTHEDNVFVGSDYLKPFEHLSAAMKEVYLLGHLADTTDPDQLIHPEHVKAAFDRDPEQTRMLDGGRGALGVDVARYGDDDTVFQRFEGFHLAETLAFHGQDIPRTARQTNALLAEHVIGADRCAVDEDGMGAGVVDLCRDEGFSVVGVQSGSRAVRVPDWKTQMTFANLRSQMWYHFGERLKCGGVSLGVQPAARTRLREDLLAPRYRVEKKGDVLTVSVEPKDGRSPTWSVKRRLGRSTDYADPVIYRAFVEYIRLEQGNAALPSFRGKALGSRNGAPGTRRSSPFAAIR